MAAPLKPVEATQTEESGSILFGDTWDHAAGSSGNFDGGFRLCDIPGVPCTNIGIFPPGCPYNLGFTTVGCALSIDTTQQLVSYQFDPYWCAGAYLGVGWPFNFKASYPDKIGPGDKADIQISVQNKLQGGSAQGACKLGGGHALEAFAGMKAGITVGLHIDPGNMIQGPVWDWIKGLIPMGIPTFNFGPQDFDIMDVVKGLVGLSDPIYVEQSSALGNVSPLGGMALPSTSEGFSLPISFPGIGQWLAALNLGLKFGITPAAQDIAGMPYADKNGRMADTSPSGQTTVGDQGNVDPKTETKFSVKHEMKWSSQWQSPLNPNGPPPPKVDFGVTNLEQDVTITPWLQPTTSIGILNNAITFPINLPITINLPSATLPLHANDLKFNGMDRYPGKPDLTVTQIVIDDLTQNAPGGYVGYDGDQLLIHAVAKNIAPAVSAGYNGFASFTVYDGNTELAHVTAANPGLCKPTAHGDLLPGTTSECDLWKGNEITTTNYLQPHVIKVCVNPDRAIDEADFTNNCMEETVNVFAVLLPRFDFAVSILPRSQTIKAGESAQYEVSVTWAGAASSQTQYVSTFDITSWSPSEPSDLTYGFTACSGPIPCTSTLTIATLPKASAGTYTMTVTVSDGIHTHAAPAILIIQAPPPQPPQCEPPLCKPGYDFSIEASPTSQHVYWPGGSTSYAISVKLTNGSPPPNQPLVLTLSGCPKGATCQLNPPSQSGKPPFTSTLRVNISKSTPLSAFTITVKGTWGSVEKSTTVTVNVIVAQ